MARILPTEEADLELKGIARSHSTVSQEIDSMFEANMIQRSGYELIRWTPERLKQEQEQIRLWKSGFSGNEYLWRKFLTLQAKESGSSFDVFRAMEKARFDLHGNFIGPRLQVTYLY
jgi:hypothetical protein